MQNTSLPQLGICIKSAGEMGSGIACRLHSAGFKRIVMLDVEKPLAVRRKVSFCEAIYEGSQVVEGKQAIKVTTFSEIKNAWEKGSIGVAVDPDWDILQTNHFDVSIDAILAKKNLGTQINEASLVIGLGPGFTAEKDVHCVIETNRGHHLGRIIYKGSAEPNTGIPGQIGGYTSERVLRAPVDGKFHSHKEIGDLVKRGDILGIIKEEEIKTGIDGVVRGLIRDKTPVKNGCKLGDVDPRGDISYCSTISEKARAIGGAVLEAILQRYNS